MKEAVFFLFFFFFFKKKKIGAAALKLISGFQVGSGQSFISKKREREREKKTCLSG